MSASEKLQNADAAILELSMFFVRHSLPYWPAHMAPVLLALRGRDGVRALDVWGRMALLGENGLMQTRISYDGGYRVRDPLGEQQHFERLLQQALDAMNNLRLYLRSGVNKALIDIYPDTAL
jgi:hypothetical protein